MKFKVYQLALRGPGNEIEVEVESSLVASATPHQVNELVRHFSQDTDLGSPGAQPGDLVVWEFCDPSRCFLLGDMESEEIRGSAAVRMLSEHQVAGLSNGKLQAAAASGKDPLSGLTGEQKILLAFFARWALGVRKVKESFCEEFEIEPSVLRELAQRLDVLSSELVRR